jgi:gas vesicle protein
MMKLYGISNLRLGKARNVAQTTSAKAKDVARSTSKNVRSTSKSVRNSAQDTLASAKDTVQLAYTQVQKSMKAGWNKILVWLTSAIAIAGAFIQKNMCKAQKNLQKMQGSLQSNVRSSSAKTSKVIGNGTSKAQYGLKLATTRAQEMQEAWQEQSARRQRKRKRARMLFRWGVISGVALALLYSPIAGSETRQRIGKGWRQSYAYFRNRRQGVPA